MHSGTYFLAIHFLPILYYLYNVLISAIGAFCDLNQDVTSGNYTEGAAVAIEMQEYERERDQCPMHFDDGSNPWVQTENFIKVFHYGYYYSSGNCLNILYVTLFSTFIFTQIF